MTAGRPTKYRPEYCDQIVEFCAQGYSLTAFANEIGCVRSAIELWAERYPKFMLAKQRAKHAAAKWWEDRGRAVASGEPGNTGMSIFGLKNMAPDDWQERRDPATGPIVVQIAQAVIHLSAAPAGVLNAGVIDGQAVEVIEDKR